ncbi:unnamed protein product [Sordaria macrospora k-hell]|uniref:WGS project CABT00000000 data, contig 2.22 n=2 Tax=Sordaria macrospora TaxID=5147 RepID=F7W2N1_SORMK|nr:uncharacterized protein SMAC_05093 [Sordaria macrospora k-hell]CCC11882.1 unnamed protein product [Sordaria macrospora k-hell]
MFCQLSSDVKFWSMVILGSGLILLWTLIITHLAHKNQSPSPISTPSQSPSACRATVTVTVTVAPTTSTVMGRMMKILSAEPVCSWEPPEGIPLPASSPTLVGTSQVPRYTDPVNKRGRLASRHPGQVPHCGTDHPSYHHLLENLNTLCNISQGSKVSYANVRGPCASSSGPKGGFKSKPDIKVDKIFAGGDEAELQISSTFI